MARPATDDAAAIIAAELGHTPSYDVVGAPQGSAASVSDQTPAKERAGRWRP